MKRAIITLILLVGPFAGAHYSGYNIEEDRTTRFLYFFDAGRHLVGTIDTLYGDENFPSVIQLKRPWMMQYAAGNDKNLWFSQDRDHPVPGSWAKMDQLLIYLFSGTLEDTASTIQTGKIKIKLRTSSGIPDLNGLYPFGRPFNRLEIWDMQPRENFPKGEKCVVRKPKREVWRNFDDPKADKTNVPLTVEYVTQIVEWQLDYIGRWYNHSYGGNCDLANNDLTRTNPNSGCIPSKPHPACGQRA